MPVSLCRIRCLGRLILLSATLVGCAGLVPDSPDACKFDKITELPIKISRSSQPTVTIEIDGKPLNLLLDTGASSAVIFESALDRTGLRKDLRYHGVAGGAGGYTSLDAIRADVLKLGDITLLDEILAVAPFDLTLPGSDAIDGLLGFSLLGKYDVDLDLPHHRMVLYRARYCPNGVPPWDTPGRVVQRPANAPFDGKPYAPITVNGKRLLGLLDTGATAVFIARPVVTAMGITEADLAADHKIMIGNASKVKVENIAHRFDNLNFLGLSVDHPTLGIIPSSSGVDLIVGMPILAVHRVWIPVQGRKIHVSLPITPQ